MPHVILAFDRQTARSFDADGRMRVKNCILSTAEVNPYRGEEIPGYERLGLKAQTVYELYRDPDELKRAAPTFEGVPLMIKHIAQTAAEPRKEYIGGSIHNVRFEGKHLRGDLLVWDGHAIDLIQSEVLPDLSCSYRYDAVMAPGTENGTKHDGVMTNLQGNHVALVDDGRASNAHVADAAFKPQSPDPSMQGEKSMALEQTPGAPAAAAPVAAPEAQPGMAEIGAALKQIATLLQAIHGKVNGAEPVAGAPADNAPSAAVPAAEDSELDENGKPKMAKDFTLEKTVQEKGAVAEDSEMPATGGEIVDVPAPDQDGDGARGGNTPEPVVGAMDAKTVTKRIDAAVAAERQRAQAVADAKRDVVHVLGDVAMDSAEDIYREALAQSGIDVASLPKGTAKLSWQAFRQVQAVAGGAMPRHAGTNEHAMDAAAKSTATASIMGHLNKISVKG
jgi:hypothetical protein